MRWYFLAVGRPSFGFVREGVEEYLKRLRGLATVEVDYVKAESGAGERILRRTEGMFRVVLDERGQQVTSRELSARVAGWEQDRVKTIAVLIGGAEGHGDAVRQAAGWTWALGRLTLQHELALLVAMEQVYRAYAIKGGLPYHRD
jgi:23S rRNA (pseudouridine1915-N3)-methyltransferase